MLKISLPPRRLKVSLDFSKFALTSLLSSTQNSIMSLGSYHCAEVGCMVNGMGVQANGWEGHTGSWGSWQFDSWPAATPAFSAQSLHLFLKVDFLNEF